MLTLLTAAAAARYFLPVPPALTAPNLFLLSRHKWLFLPHIGGGIVAAVIGLFQFVAVLRKSRPAVHRTLGTIYVAAIVVAATTAFGVSFSLFRAFSMPSSFPGMPAMFRVPAAQGLSFVPAFLAFVTLSLAWLIVTLRAYWLARQRRWDEHRAWMVRSYALTFAVVTVRLSSVPILLLTHRPVLATSLAIWTWPLNLAAAEWILRTEHEGKRIAVAAAS